MLAVRRSEVFSISFVYFLINEHFPCSWCFISKSPASTKLWFLLPRKSKLNNINPTALRPWKTVSMPNNDQASVGLLMNNGICTRAEYHLTIYSQSVLSDKLNHQDPHKISRETFRIDRFDWICYNLINRSQSSFVLWCDAFIHISIEQKFTHDSQNLAHWISEMGPFTYFSCWQIQNGANDIKNANSITLYFAQIKSSRHCTHYPIGYVSNIVWRRCSMY